MSKHILSFVRGIGSVLDIMPTPGRVISEPLYHLPRSQSEALGRYWSQVGAFLGAAMDETSYEQTTKSAQAE